MFQQIYIVTPVVPPCMWRIKNAAQVRRHLAEWSNYKLRLPRGSEGVEFYQTLDQHDLSLLQTSFANRARRDGFVKESMERDSRKGETASEYSDDESVVSSGSGRYKAPDGFSSVRGKKDKKKNQSGKPQGKIWM